MSGPFELGIVWPDASLEQIASDYACVTILLSESSGRAMLVTARGYIGHRISGFWDESVVETAKLVEGHPFEKECLDELARRFGKSLQPSGCVARNEGLFRTLEVTLIDGAKFVVTAGEFDAEEVKRGRA